jgi:hypothetical protein
MPGSRVKMARAEWEDNMKNIAVMAMLVPVAVLSFFACTDSDEGHEDVVGPQAADLSKKFMNAEPCVVAAAADQAWAAASEAVAGAPAGASQEELTALADDAAARVYADIDLAAVQCDPNVTVTEAGVCDGMAAREMSEASLASWGGILCRAACWAAAGAGCGAVSAACAGVTVITIGGTSIPCGAAIIAACAAAGGGASVCSDLCPD